MELTQEQYRQIEDCFPKHRGKLTYSNLEVLNAILYVAENGVKWRKLPESFGNWHTIYTRMRNWTRKGVLARAFEALQKKQIIRIKIEAASIDSTSVKVHPDGTGALKKKVRNPLVVLEEDSPPKFIWLPQTNEQLSAFPFLQDKQEMLQKGGSY